MARAGTVAGLLLWGDFELGTGGRDFPAQILAVRGSAVTVPTMDIQIGLRREGKTVPWRDCISAICQGESADNLTVTAETVHQSNSANNALFTKGFELTSCVKQDTWGESNDLSLIHI